jgi:hypothetical protein
MFEMVILVHVVIEFFSPYVHLVMRKLIIKMCPLWEYNAWGNGSGLPHRYFPSSTSLQRCDIELLRFSAFLVRLLSPVIQASLMSQNVYSLSLFL